MEEDLRNMLNQLQVAQLGRMELEENQAALAQSEAEAREAETKAYLMLSQVQEQTRLKISELSERTVEAELKAERTVGGVDAELAAIKAHCEERIAAAKAETETAKSLLRESTADAEESAAALHRDATAELRAQLELVTQECGALRERLSEVVDQAAAAAAAAAAELVQTQAEAEAAVSAVDARVAAAKRAADERIEIAMSSALSSDQARMDLEEEQAGAAAAAVAAAVAETRDALLAEQGGARLQAERLRLQLEKLRQSSADEVAEAQMAQAEAGSRAAERLAAAEAKNVALAAEAKALQEGEAELRRQVELAEERAAALGKRSLDESMAGTAAGGAGGLGWAGEPGAEGRELLSPQRSNSSRLEKQAVEDYDPDETAMFRMSEETNAAVLADMKLDMQQYRRVAGAGSTLKEWARTSDWAHDTGVDIGRATTGKWKELFEEVTMDEAMREALADNTSASGPSPVATLNAAKKLAEEQCQLLSAENDQLESDCLAMRKKLISLESIMTHTERLEAKAEAAAKAREAELQEESVNRSAVGELLVKHLTPANLPLARTQALGVLAAVLELSEEQKIEIGLVSRWELAKPSLVKQVEDGSNQQTFVDMWTTFLSGS